MNKIIALVIIASITLACGGNSSETTTKNDEDTYSPLPFIGEHDIDYVTDENGNEVLDSVYYVAPGFKLMNQDSVDVTEKDVEGVVHVANFFFTSCPTICPSMIEHMKRLQEHTADIDEIIFLSHTIDPERDSIPRLREYIAEREIDTKNWHFLYGEREYIHLLGNDGYKINAMVDEAAEGGFLHSQYFILLDRERHIRGLYDGTITEEVDKMEEDIRALIKHEYN